MTIQWCKSHIWDGNNKADKLAKNAINKIETHGELNLTLKTTPISLYIIKNAFKKRILEDYKPKQSKQMHVISSQLDKWNMLNIFNDTQCQNDVKIISRLNY